MNSSLVEFLALMFHTENSAKPGPNISSVLCFQFRHSAINKGTPIPQYVPPLMVQKIGA